VNQENDYEDTKETRTDDTFEEVNQVVYKFIPNGYHTWRQQGYYLVCKSCDLQHSVFIGPHLVMVGEREGKPILEKRQDRK
jgi:hypothetical protein